MKSLVVDLGSTHFKGRVYHGTRPLSEVVRVKLVTHFSGARVELHKEEVAKALGSVLRELSPKGIDHIVFSNQAPCLALQSNEGELLGSLITHLDRRSTEEAKVLEKHFGKTWWLSMTGNRPYPGGLAVTSLLWLKKKAPLVFRRVHTFGSLGSYVTQLLTGNNVIDPGNASLMGLTHLNSGGWNQDLLSFLEMDVGQLPEIREAGLLCGEVKRSLARSFHLPAGIPVLVGVVDTSACVLGANLGEGDLLHSSGTTDVTAVLQNKPKPSESFLTRPLGIGEKWLALRTISSSGSTLDWVERLFGMKDPLSTKKTTEVHFEPYLSGDRLSLEPKRGILSQLTLATSREDIVNSIYQALGRQSVESITTLNSHFPLNGKVIWSGGSRRLAAWFHSRWMEELKLNWKFKWVEELGLSGLAKLSQRGVLHESTYDRTG